jgi:hypothetical protein
MFYSLIQFFQFNYGPADLIASLAYFEYFSKFLANLPPSNLSVTSKSFLSLEIISFYIYCQVFLGFRTSGGTFGQVLGIYKLNTGKVEYSAESKCPS